MGFSHGSCLASTLLLHGALKGEAMPVQCAVFLSPGMALDWEALERGEVRMFGGGRVGEGMVFEGEVDERRMAKGKGAIKIPTAHIWGQNDSCAPRQGRLLSELCAEEVRETALHQGGHSVPGAGVKRELEEAVRAIEKAMKRAEGVI
jgi:pimeloyl-ACP methyl ester carboxylesterase